MHIPHELPEEFPGEAALIERLARDNYSSNDWPSATTTSIARFIALSRKNSRPRMRCLKDSKKIASSSRMRSPACSRAKSAECKAGWSTSDPQRRNAVRAKVDHEQGGLLSILTTGSAGC